MASLLQTRRHAGDQPTNQSTIFHSIYTADHPLFGSQGKSDTPLMFDPPDILEDQGSDRVLDDRDVVVDDVDDDDDDDDDWGLEFEAADQARYTPHAISTPKALT
jgi:hypothetical protein